MIIETLSVFPEMFDGPMSASILGRAQESGHLQFEAHDLREFSKDKHRNTDDEIYGGGQGLLMMCQPIFDAIDFLREQPSKPKPHIIFFTPAGRQFSDSVAHELTQYERLVLVCGRYEGIDERAYTLADECISLGDYVLTGGELAAMVVSDAVVRLLPGVLGDEQSAVDESFHDGLLEFPQYTRPAEYKGMKVPEILLSGHHEKIAQWKRKEAIKRTAQLRPDLLKSANLSDEERAWAKDLAGTECFANTFHNDAGFDGEHPSTKN